VSQDGGKISGDAMAEVAECADKGHLMPILISADEAESPQGARGQGEQEEVGELE
jgi:hypothetical protein